MLNARKTRILVVTDTAAPTPTLLDAISRRAVRGKTQFRVVVTNPARAEVHLLHPERHDKAAEAEEVLRAGLAALEEAAGSHVIGSVSVFHDPMDAIERIVEMEPLDEIILAVAPHPWATRLHQDLPHRLAHLHLTIIVPVQQTAG
jgi:hypothetical protein